MSKLTNVVSQAIQQINNAIPNLDITREFCDENSLRLTNKRADEGIGLLEFETHLEDEVEFKIRFYTITDYEDGHVFSYSNNVHILGFFKYEETDKVNNKLSQFIDWLKNEYSL